MNTRKVLRLPDFDYSQNGAYFFTICVQGRRPMLGSIYLVGAGSKPAHEDLSIENVGVKLSDAGKIVMDTWLDLPNHNSGIGLGPFIVMPDHVHGILMLRERAGFEPAPTELTETIRQFKTFSSRRINKLLNLSPPLWQRSFYEHVIRNEQDFQDTALYIEANPLRYILKQYS